MNTMKEEEVKERKYFKELSTTLTDEQFKRLIELMLMKLDTAIKYQETITKRCNHPAEVEELLLSTLSRGKEDLAEQILSAKHIHKLQEISTFLDEVMD